MQGMIVVNAFVVSESELNQPLRLKEELERLGVRTEIRRNDMFLAHLSEKGLSACADDVDFCIYLDKDPYASQLLEQAGLRLFNPHGAVFACDDKMQTYLSLAGSGIRIPETYSGRLCYTQGAQIDGETFDRLERALGYPMVVKECFGSLGKGVYLASDRNDLCALSRKLQYSPHLFQKFVSESSGRDVRVICVGGEPIAAMLRRSDGDFRSNLGCGGKGERYPIDDEIKRISGTVSRRLNLDYCGIDLLLGVDGYILCEVNSNAYFGGIERVTGVNVAKRYAEYIVDVVSRTKK